MKNANEDLIEELSLMLKNRRSQFIAFACSYVRDHDEAEDLFMDSVMALWQTRDKLAPDTNYPALMLTILKNKCLDYLLRQKKKDGIGKNLLSLYERELNLRISTLQATSPDKIFSAEIQDIVTETLIHLPEQSRHVFEMSRYQHKTNKDIAAELGLSVKSVEFHITKCLKVLRVALRDYVNIILFI